MDEPTFFDIHCHTMNLSHPYLLAFVNRYNLPLVLLLSSVLGPLASLLMNKRLNRVKNLLAIMENDVGDLLFLAEGCLRNDHQESLFPNGQLQIGDRTYSKIVLTPLLIDFGYKGFNNPYIHYNHPSKKPIVEQVTDVFTGIKDYMDPSKRNESKKSLKLKETPLFEIYPFLGINTQNYYLGAENGITIMKKPDLTQLSDSLQKKLQYQSKQSFLIYHGKMTEKEKVELLALFDHPVDRLAIDELYQCSQTVNDRNTIPKMLEKYFGAYTGRRSDLASNLGKFDGNIDHLSNHFFAGIKVYPPLGFDPWPDDNELELAKVKYLYQYCSDKQIPITAHCSCGGFRVIGRKFAQQYTSPSRWQIVLENYPSLKINLAHFGFQKKTMRSILATQWMEQILQLILKYENVYTDFSYRGTKKKYYRTLRRLIDRTPEAARPKLLNHILFGSDFMINLIKIDSYFDFYEFFHSSAHLTAAEKDRFGSQNPERFLFKT
ncbi:MAG TPA: amidohydrolase family protein [Bacillota bacterium]|nr:amidohydrolase family protein [Bacillota bacterium]